MDRFVPRAQPSQPLSGRLNRKRRQHAVLMEQSIADGGVTVGLFAFCESLMWENTFFSLKSQNYEETRFGYLFPAEVII